MTNAMAKCNGQRQVEICQSCMSSSASRMPMPVVRRRFLPRPLVFSFLLVCSFVVACPAANMSSSCICLCPSSCPCSSSCPPSRPPCAPALPTCLLRPAAGLPSPKSYALHDEVSCWSVCDSFISSSESYTCVWGGGVKGGLGFEFNEKGGYGYH